MGVGRTKPVLILASASPRRLELLRQVGVDPGQVIPADIDETPQPGERAGALVQRLAIAKALTVHGGHSTPDKGANFITLGADTVVACGRRILPKAQDEDEARRTLELLSGRRHTVFTGVAVVNSDGQCRHRLVKTAVAFKRLDWRELEGYLKCGEWRGKAGAYGIQGRAAAFIRFINGSYSNVVGLPLFETAALLGAAGYPVLDNVCDA